MDDHKVRVSITYSTWRFIDDSGDPEEDHGFECEGSDYDVEELDRLIVQGGYIFPSNSPLPNVGEIGNTWLSTEACNDHYDGIVHGWNRQLSIHLGSKDEVSLKIWHEALNKAVNA